MPKHIRRTGIVGKQSFQRDLERIRAALIAAGGAAPDSHIHEYDTNNVVTGETAGQLGTDNVIMGDLAGENIPAGAIDSVIIGAQAGRYADAGSDYSVLIGYQAGQYVESSGSVIIGYRAGDSDAINAANNVMIGKLAGSGATGANLSNNVFVGALAGIDAVGYSNTFLGEGAGYQNSATLCIAIGDYAGANGSTDERLYIGSGASPLIYGEFDDDNLGINSTDMGGGVGVIAIKDATTVPTSNPTGGGILYVESGALKYRGSSGTVTPIASA